MVSDNNKFDWSYRTTQTVLDLPFIEGIPTPQKATDLTKWVRQNSDRYQFKYVKLYHATDPGIPIEKEGLKPTSATRRRSFQSSSGYVYLANTPERAKAFGDRGNQGRSVVYEVLVQIRHLLADKDQLNNQRSVGRVLGDSVGESIAYGGGVRVKGAIAPWAIRLMPAPGCAPDLTMNTSTEKIMAAQKKASIALQTTENQQYYNKRLHLGAARGELDMCLDALDNGADILSLDSVDRSALQVAALGGYALVCAQLIKSGADVNLQSTDDLRSALDYAVREHWPSHIATAEILLDAGANLHAKNKQGECAIHAAIDCNCAKMCLLLLERGASADLESDEQLIALATQLFRPAIVTLISAWSARRAAWLAIEELMQEPEKSKDGARECAGRKSPDNLR